MTTLEAGTRLGPYELAGPLGAGGMGQVYKAVDLRLNRTVAIKILPDTGIEQRQRFEREAKAIAALSHPNICTLHDIGHDKGIDFLVIEFLEGETLADRLKRGPVAEDVLIDLARQIADALEAAHAANITHRDLKPLNIFVTRRGTAKVLDFGLAKMEPPTSASPKGSGLETIAQDLRLTSPGTSLGTVGYMSPEQARGDDTDHRSDIFAFGAVLYEMATGHPAFQGKTAALIFDQVLNREPASPHIVNSRIPPDLERIIDRALEKDPDRRYQSVTELRADLDRLGREPLSRQPSGDVSTGAARSRRPAFMTLIALAAVLIVCAVVAAAVIVARRRATGPVATIPIDSIAVLPFVNAGGTPEADYLAEGITGTLTNSLTQLRSLRVIPRTLAARYRNQTIDPGEAGRTLNARAIVTGRIVQNGDRLIIEAELIDTATVAQLWGDQFDRPLADVLRVQAEISRAIADSLRLRITREDEKVLGADAARDSVAYQLCLRGQYAANRRSKEGYRQATQYFSQAIERDPSYALAYAGLGDAAMWQAYWGYEPAAEAYGRGLAAARKAVELDERSAEGHALLGWISLYHDWDWAASDREYRRALALDPTSATIHGFYGEALGTRGRFDEAIAEVKRAAALDPLSGRTAVSVGFMLTNARRFDEAIAALKHAAELDPDQSLARLDLARVYRLAGKVDLAIAESERMLDTGDPLGPAFLAMSYARAGRSADARRLLATLEAETRRSRQGLYLVGMVHAAMGNRDEAFRWLDEAYNARDTFLPWLKVDPDFDPIRGDPRFDALVRRIGIP